MTWVLKNSSHWSTWAVSMALLPYILPAFLARYLRRVRDSKMGPSSVSMAGIFPKGFLLRCASDFHYGPGM